MITKIPKLSRTWAWLHPAGSFAFILQSFSGSSEGELPLRGVPDRSFFFTWCSSKKHLHQGGAGIDLIVSKTARKGLKGVQGISFGTVHKKQIFKCWCRCGAPSVSRDVINDSLSLWKDHFQRTNNDQSSQAEGLWSGTYYVTYMVWLVSLHCTSSG